MLKIAHKGDYNAMRKRCPGTCNSVHGGDHSTLCRPTINLERSIKEPGLSKMQKT